MPPVLAVEAQAIIQVIHLGFSTGFSSFVMGLDSQSVCHKVHMNKPDLFPAGNFIQAIRNSFLSYNYFSVDTLITLKYVSRSANVVAHNLVHMSSTIFACRIWFNNFPYQLYPLVVYILI